MGLGPLRLSDLPDERSRRSRRRSLRQLFTTVLAGLAAGCRSLAEVERLTEQMSRDVRRKLGVPSRIPDTTLRDLLVGFSLDALRGLLHRQTRAAHRGKKLRPVGLPCGVVALDGKHTSTNLADGTYAQIQGEKAVARTLTASLVSARAPVCIDAMPIPKARNEESVFAAALHALLAVYGDTELFEVVTADAGITSRANADLVHECGLGYVFALKETQPTLLSEAHRLLARRGADEASATTTDRASGTLVIRRVWLSTEMAAYHGWTHLRTVARVQSEHVRDGEAVAVEDRYFASNVPVGRFGGPDGWLRVVRAHWRVENECHGVYDRLFREDDRPWMRDAHGLLVVALLRRIVVNMLDLYRRVSRRGEDGPPPWLELCDWIRVALVAAGPEHVHGLRWPRDLPPPRRRPPPITAVVGEA